VVLKVPGLITGQGNIISIKFHILYGGIDTNGKVESLADGCRQKSTVDGLQSWLTWKVFEFIRLIIKRTILDNYK
jgi:hypothetical protein